MNNEYHDIRSRIAEPPKWWDECAVPRYCDFAPKHAANIYAREAALVLIECQACRRQFNVSMSGRTGRVKAEIMDGRLHYGDPPNVECCVAGPTMNCIDVKVLEYWRREDMEWERDPSLEIELEGRRPGSLGMRVVALTTDERPAAAELDAAPVIESWRWSPMDTGGLQILGLRDGKDFVTGELFWVDTRFEWVRGGDGSLYRLGRRAT